MNQLARALAPMQRRPRTNDNVHGVIGTVEQVAFAMFPELAQHNAHVQARKQYLYLKNHPCRTPLFSKEQHAQIAKEIREMIR